MANKRFGVKEINLVGAAGTPTIESPDNLNINAVNVAISTNATVGGTLDVDGSTELDDVNVSGITTLGTVEISSGIVTAASGIVTYYGDGSELSEIVTSIVAGTNIVLNGGPTGIVTINSSATVDGLWSLDGDNVYYDTAGGNIGIGTTDPTSKLDVDGTLNVSGVSTFQDKVIFDSTNSIQVPVGTEAEKDAVGTAVTGQIRYNTTNSQFEGFGPGNGWGSLGGVKDVDGDTYVKAESSPGSDEDAITFFTGGTERAVIDSNGNIGIGITNPISTSKLVVSGQTDIIDGNLRLDTDYNYTLTGTITTSTSTGVQTYFGCNVACNSDGSSIMVVGLNTSGQGTISIFDRNETNSDNYDFVGLVTDTTVIVGYGGTSTISYTIDELPSDCVMSADGNIFGFSSGAGQTTVGAGNTIVIWQRSGNTLSQLGLIEYDALTGFGATEGIFEYGSVEFGSSMDMSADGTKFVVGAWCDRVSNVGVGTTIFRGRVHVIDRNESTFTGIATLVPDETIFPHSPYADEGISDSDRFGWNAVISDDGNTIVVAHQRALGSVSNGYGAIYKYSRSGPNTIIRTGISTVFEGEYSNVRGSGLEISGDGTRIFVGAVGAYVAGNTPEYVYVLDSDLNVLQRILLPDSVESPSAEEDRKRLQSSYDGKTFMVGATWVYNKSQIYKYSELREEYIPVGNTINVGSYYSDSNINGCAVTNDGTRIFHGDSTGSSPENRRLEYVDITSNNSGRVGIGVSNPSTELHVKGTATITEGVKGSIRQVVGYSTDAIFTTSLIQVQHNAVTDMGVEINLSSSSNKVLVTYDLTGEFSSSGGSYNSGISFERHSSVGVVTVTPGNADAGYYNNPDNRNRGITTPVISYSSDNSSTPEKLSIINFLDSPNTTGIVTYYPTIYTDTNMNWFGNRTSSDANLNGYERFISYITLQEIVG